MGCKKKIVKKKIATLPCGYDDIDDEFSMLPDKSLRTYFRARSGKIAVDDQTYKRVKVELSPATFNLLHGNKYVYFDVAINDLTAIPLAQIYRDIRRGRINITVFSTPFGGYMPFHICNVDEAHRSIIPKLRLGGYGYPQQCRPFCKGWKDRGLMIAECSIIKGNVAGRKIFSESA